MRMPGFSRTRPAAATQSSCISTVSAPVGIGAPVKMRTASPRRDRAVERVSRRGAAANGQFGFAIGEQIGKGHGIAVDRAVGVRRQVERGDPIGGENAPGRHGQRHRLNLDDRHHARLDPGERLVDAQQVAAKGKAIVAQLGHRPRPS